MLHAWRRLVAFLRRRRLDDELAEEIRLHLDLRRRALIDDGLTPEAAEREARRQFGNVTAIRERSRDHWGSVAMSAFVQDVKFGARILATSPWISLVIVLTIAFGSGLNGAVFVEFSNTFLRAPDLNNAETLVWLDDGGPRTGGVTYPDYLDYRDRVTGIDLAVYGGGGKSLVPGKSDPSETNVALVSGNYFRVLQASAAIGRTFGPSEDLRPFGTAVAVLSDAYWTRHFGRASDVLGKTIDLSSKPFTIIGVMPSSFATARRRGSAGSRPDDVWVPIQCRELLDPGTELLTGRTFWWGLQSIGRLRDATSLPQAGAQIRLVAAALDAEYPGQRSARAPLVWRATEFDPRVLHSGEVTMYGIGGAATLLVMLIACGNVAGLLLARASARRQEIAIRLSLGATRIRIVRQFLAEGMMLSISGTLLGVVLARWLTVSMAGAAGTSPTTMDGRVILYALFLVVVATLSTGLMPAVQASRTAPQLESTRSQPPGGGRLRAWLVGIEVTISLVMLLATALLLRGVTRAAVVDPVLPVDELVTITLDANRHGYAGARLDALYLEARHRLEALPGVRSTTLVSPAPFSGNRSNTPARRADAADSAPVVAFLAEVSPDFPDATGLRAIGGRWFSGSSGDEVVVNESLAARLWPKGDAIGQRMTTGDFNRRSHVVVGVVRDAPYAELRHQHQPFLFRPGRSGAILLRTSGSPSALSRPAADAVKQLDDRLMVTALLPSERIAQDRAAGRRLISVAGVAGGLALVIALGGIAAIAAYAVASRTREIGIRMALGAGRADAVALIVRRALRPVMIGALAGLAIASLGSRLLVAQLYGISPLDPAAFAGTALFVVMMATAAAWLPARRAARVDPVRALRRE